MSFNYKSKTVTGTTDSNGAADIRIDTGALGYDPDGVYAQHQIQTTVQNSGAWSLVGMLPNGGTVPLVSSCQGGDMVMVGPKGLSTIGNSGPPAITTMSQNGSAYLRFGYYKIVVAGGGNEQPVEVFVRSDAIAW